MNASNTKFQTQTVEQRQKEELVRRFIHLPPDRRRHFLTRLSEQGIDFSLLPVPAGLAGTGDAPLSYAQQRLWFLSRLDPDSTAYHMTSGLRIRGKLNAQAVRAAFTRIQAHHAVLRTTFHEIDGQAVQRVHEFQALPYREFDFSSDQRLSEAEIRHLAEAEARRPFDLTQGPLWRVTLIRLPDGVYELWLSLHHIVADGWSLNCLTHEFSRFYQADQCASSHDNAAPEITYADYAIWQRAWLEAGEADRQLAFWLSYLEGDQPLLRLPENHTRPGIPSNRGGRVPFSCNEQLIGQLRDLARKQGITLSNILLAAYLIVLYRYSGQHDLRVGIPLANRGRSEVEAVVGFFVNTVVIRIPMQGQLSVHELLHAVRTAMIDAQAHPDLPFEQLVDALPHARSLDRNPLFQAMYNHQQRAYDALSIPGLEISPVDRDAGGAQVDLSLNTEERSIGLQGFFTYALDLFEHSTIERLAHHWQRVLAAMARDSSQRVAEVPLLDKAEMHRVLQESNAAATDDKAIAYVHALFEAQVERTPEATALTLPHEGQELSLTYAALNTQANRLAHRLRSLGVGPDILVGIAAERSIVMVVGLLAILKAGGAYVALDPEYPAERLTYMMTDSGINLLLTQERLRARLTIPHHIQVLYLEGESEVDWCGEPGGNLPLITQPDNLAYVLYTSGSTGQPKAAGNTHRGLYNRLDWMQSAYALTPGEGVLQKTPIGFDVSVWELLWPLQVGARMVLAAPGAHRDPAELVRLIQTHRITTLHFVPSMLQEFLTADGIENCRQLKRVICSGEALEGEQAGGLFARLPQVEIHNLYGPTECAIDVTHWPCDRAADLRRTIPIGRPIAQTVIRILDRDLNPVPEGVTGELYLGGWGVGRGYWGQGALTAERFVPDPYGPPGTRLYRSGDLGYWKNGVIEYVGRLDEQIKLRGQRIELGEITSQLLRQPGVREAAVLVREDRIVGYAVGDHLDVEALRQGLRDYLPEAMVPAKLMILEQLPKTVNGKLDRKALPAPEWTGKYRHPPETEWERKLAQLWQEVLGIEQIEQIGREDSFFDLGGHSLLAMRLVAKLKSAWRLDISVRDVFEHPALAALAEVLQALSESHVDGHDFMSDLADAFAELQALSPEQVEDLSGSGQSVSPIHQVNNKH